MSTGDIKNNLRKLQNELKLIQYTNEIDYEKMLIGLSAPYLPILHFVFTEYSRELSSYFSSKGHDLFGKSDFRFLEIIYKILIQEFETKPMLTKNQFFAIGYSEMKMIFVTKIVNICRQKYNSLVKKSAPKKKKVIKKTNQNKNILSDEEEIRYPVSISQSECDFNLPAVDVDFKIDRSKDSNPEPVIHHGDSSEVTINAPKPSPILALTPIKTHIEEMVVNGKDFDLDLSDIGEESFVETGGVELVDISTDDEEMPQLPEFSITKHSDKVIKINENNLSLNPNLESNVSTKSLLPSNIDLVSPQLIPHKQAPTDKKEQQCQLCSSNASDIKQLCQRVKEIESKLAKYSKENYDLSSKVFLLENKVKMMESSEKNEISDKRSDKSVSEDITITSDVCSNFETLNMHSEASESTKPVGKSYSPIKYTDDNIIIKDFKPISMRDVHNMMNEESKINKENQQGALKMKNLMARKEPLSFKVFSDDSSKKTCVSSFTFSDEIDDLSSDSYNVSKLDDDFTEQAIANVKRKLRETENMLKSCENYL